MKIKHFEKLFPQLLVGRSIITSCLVKGNSNEATMESAGQGPRTSPSSLECILRSGGVGPWIGRVVASSLCIGL